MNAMEATADIAGAPDLWMSMLKSGAMLCLVLAVLVFFVFIMRRFAYQGGATGKNSPVKILSTTHVAPKERIVLVDVMGERLLLGVTAQSINTLARIPVNEDSEKSEQEIPATSISSPSPSFMNHLKLAGFSRKPD